MSVVYEAKAAESLESLGLKTAHDHLDQAAQQAVAGRWSYTHFLGYLLDGEMDQRRRRAIEMSLQFAKFPYQKRLEDFDYDAQPSIDRRLVEELATVRFCAEGRNVVLLGPPGVGKTHLAIALGVRVCELGQQAVQRVAEGKSATPALVEFFGSTRRAEVMAEAGKRAEERIHQQKIDRIASDAARKE